MGGVGALYGSPPVLTFQDIGEGGSGTRNVRLFLPGSGLGSTIIWWEDVGGEPMG